MTTLTPHTTLASSFDQFIRELDKSALTIQAYRTDIKLFIIWLSENDLTITRAHHVTRSHIMDFFRSYDGFWDFFLGYGGILHDRN
ncbi:MAG TPA: site-specific integrase [Ktedonobacteraceae bacterium]